MGVVVRLVLPATLGFHEWICGVLMRIREVEVHGVRHRATTALVTAHLRLQPKVNLHMVELGFPVEVPDDVDVDRLIVDSSTTSNAIMAIVRVEQVIKDTPHRG